uniref:uncharacterized protein LOC120334967 n=1 Tax=Styela clava TaxID=7725 RepID=UPI00193A3E87|nr:uncharacterized protein LOC120334967 [Styela clava]
MKVICAGIPKTGTKTMAEALRILGYNVHDVFQQFFYQKELWSKILANKATIKDYQRVLADVDAVTDVPACGLWEQISEAFPDAKVILMVRSSEDEWYQSIKYHFKHMSNLNYNILLYPVFNLILGPLHREFLYYLSSFLPGSLGTIYTWGQEVEVLLRSRYRQHNMYVKATCPKEKLLVFNVKEGWKPLCEFLGVEKPNVPFPIENVKTKIVDDVAKGQFEHDCGYHRTVVRQVFTRVVFLVGILLALLFFLIF